MSLRSIPPSIRPFTPRSSPHLPLVPHDSLVLLGADDAVPVVVHCFLAQVQRVVTLGFGPRCVGVDDVGASDADVAEYIEMLLLTACALGGDLVVHETLNAVVQLREEKGEAK